MDFNPVKRKIKEKNMKSPTSYTTFQAKTDCVIFPYTNKNNPLKTKWASNEDIYSIFCSETAQLLWQWTEEFC